MSNVDIGFGMVAPTATYAGLTSISKLVLAGAMILGRLEIFTILVLLVPTFWQR